MELRGFARKHLSTHSLHFLLLVSVISLGAAGKSFILAQEALMDDLVTESTPHLNLSLVHEALSMRTPAFPTTPPPSTEVPDRSLAQGEDSYEVLLLQKFLLWRGFFPKNEELTAYFGPATFEAVKRYQRANAIPDEGIVGPKTREMWKTDVLK